MTIKSDVVPVGQEQKAIGQEQKETTASWLRVRARELFNYRETGIVIALVILFVYMCFASESFRSPFNLTVVAEQMTAIAIMATGQTLVIISSAFDVSQAAVTGLSAMVIGIMWGHAGLNPILAIMIGLAIGALAGAVNGILAARFKLHPIIMTLATAVIFVSLTYVITHGQPVIGLPPQLLWAGSAVLGPIPVSAVIMLVVVALMQVLLTRTRFGLRVRQVGGNVEAARLIGVNVPLVMLGVFIISGFLSALGGVIELGRVGNAIPTLGSTLLFPIITASILGGTLLSGGEGSMVGTLAGAAVLAIINNALVVLQVDPYAQGVVQGGLVVAALILDQFRRRQLTLRDLIRTEL
jgi:ribose transport system permease protein